MAVVRISSGDPQSVREMGTDTAGTVRVSPGERIELVGIEPGEVSARVLGDDLRLDLNDGTTLTLENFVLYLRQGDARVSLSLGDGATSSTIDSLDGLADFQGASPAGLPQLAAFDTAAGSGGQGEPIGHVETLQGSVVAVRADGSRVRLAIGDAVHQGDVLQTGPDGAIGVLLLDETTFSMSENGSIVLDEMVYDAGAGSGSIALSLIQGVFTFVSGQVAKTDPDAMVLSTPIATIGVRGTQIGIDFADAETLTVVNMMEADGFVGEVLITTEAGSGVINQAYQSTSVSSSYDDPSVFTTLDVNAVVNRFQSSLRHLPNSSGKANNYGQGDDSAGLENFQTAAGGNEGQSGGGGTGSDGSVVLGAIAGNDVNVDVLPPAPPAPPGADLQPPDAGKNLNRSPQAFNGTAQGIEDNQITGLLRAIDPDGDVLTFSASGAPTGGSIVVNSTGGFIYTPTPNFAGIVEFQFLVEDGRGGSAMGTVSLEIAAVADAPIVQANSVEVIEDNLLGIPISITLTDTDGSEAITAVELGNIQPGTTLSWLDNPPVLIGAAGTFTLIGSGPGGQFSEADLAALADGSGLLFTPPLDSNADVNLTVHAVSSEVNVVGVPIAIADAPTENDSDLVVDAEAGNPTVSVAAAEIAEDATLTPEITASFTDRDDPGESQVLEIDIPAGWSVVNTNGWTDAGGGVFSKDVTANVDSVVDGTPFSVDGPILRPPLHSDADLPDLVVRAVSTQIPVDSEGSNLGPNIKIVTADPALIIVDAEAGAPVVTVANATIIEDGVLTPAITVSFADATDPSEVHTLEIDIPSGWSVVDANGWANAGGGVFRRDVSAQADSAGDGVAFAVSGPLLRPPLNDDGDLDSSGGNLPGLTVRAFASQTPDDLEGSGAAPNLKTASDTARIIVDAAAGTATVSVAPAEIIENATVVPQITASFTDVADASEAQTLEIDIPAGWTVVNANGWTSVGSLLRLNVSVNADTAGDGVAFNVTGPQLRPPTDADADLNSLTVRAIARQTPDDLEGPAANVNTATSLSTVVIDAETGNVTVSVADAGIVEDGLLTAQITASFANVDDPQEVHSLQIDIPAGWTVANANGWTNAGGGVFTKNVTGAAAAAGDNVAFLTQGPVLRPPLHGDADLPALNVRAVSLETPADGEGANVALNLKQAADTASVSIDAEAGTPVLSVADAQIVEDGVLTPQISVSFAHALDTGETHRLEIDAPAGWALDNLNGWTDMGGGVFSRDVSALADAAGDGVSFLVAGPAFRPPLNSDADISALTVRAFVVDVPEDGEGSGTALNAKTVTDTATVIVDAAAGGSTAAVADTEILEDGTLTPQITASFNEVADPNETQALEIDIPAGWSVIAANGWTDAGGGVFRLDVSGLADTAGEGVSFVVDGPLLQTAPDDDSDVALTVRAIATQTPTDGEGTDAAANVNTASDVAAITVDAVAGLPTVSLASASIDEDAPLTPVLTVSFTEVADPDEVQTVEIDIPTGWTVADANGWTDSGGGVYVRDVSALADVAGAGNDFDVDGPIIVPPPNDVTGLAALTVRAMVVQTQLDGEGADIGPNSNAVTASAAVAVNPVVDAVFTAGTDAIDLREAAGFFNNPAVNSVVFEDGNFLDALGGADTVQLPDGTDALFAAEYAGNTFLGGAGNDTLSGGTGDDSIDAGNNDDIVRYATGGGDDILAGGSGTDTLEVKGADVTADDFTLSASGLAPAITVTDNVTGGTAGATAFETVKVITGNNADRLTVTGDFSATALTGAIVYTAGGGDDVLDASGLTDPQAIAADGGIGEDDLTGGMGDDTLQGGGGDDTLRGGTGADILSGGAGGDTINYTAGDGDDDVDGGTESDVLRIDGDGAANALVLTGDGSASAEVGIDSSIVSLIGVETLEFHGGDDTDTLTVGGDLAATALGGILFFGDAGADELDASGMAAPIGIAADGGAGNDTLVGGAGADTLTGGADADRFRLNDLGNVDTIADFDPDGGDVLDLRDLLTGYTDGVDDIDDFVLFDDDGIDTTVQIDTDGTGDGAGFVDAAILSGVTGRPLDDLIASNNVDIA